MDFKDFFKNRRRELPFLIFSAFLISFSVARTYSFVYEPYLKIGDRTFYILYIGIVLIILSGWISIHYRGKTLARIEAVIFGVGMGLFFDQIGFILTHFEEYNVGITYTAVIAMILVLLNLVYFHDFWNSVSSELYTFAKENKLHYGPLNMIGIVSIFDRVENAVPGTSDLATAFSGIVLIIAGFLTLMYQDLIQYWLAAAFFLNGIAYILKIVGPSS